MTDWMCLLIAALYFGALNYPWRKVASAMRKKLFVALTGLLLLGSPSFANAEDSTGSPFQDDGGGNWGESPWGNWGCWWQLMNWYW